MAYPPPPYKDAVAGVPLAGEAIAGTWWAYPPQASLGLLAVLPSLVIVSAPDVTVGVPTAQLGLKGVLPGLVINSTLAVPESLLGLQAGAASILFVGQVFLVPSAPQVIVLTPRPCVPSDALVATVCVEELLLATVDAVG